MSMASEAASSVWTFTPLSSTTVFVPINGTSTVDYLVTNQSPAPHNLMFSPIQAITQITTAGYCPSPFLLSESNPSCTLRLEISGRAFNRAIDGGPKVCQQVADGRLSSLQCYQVSPNDALNVKHFAEYLSVSPTNLTLVADGASGQITVTSHMIRRTATDVAADFIGTALEGNVTQDATDCESIAPGESCVLTFTPTSQAITQAWFPIRGSNTRPVGASIEVTAPAQAIIKVSGSPLTLLESGADGNLTVTNTSETLTATNISADLTGALATAGVTQDASGCISVLPSASCTLVFTPGTQEVVPTTVPIQGNNTSETTASIAVNGTADLSLSGSPLNLYTNGNVGTMTVTNISTTIAAENVRANMTGTALSSLEVTPAVCPLIAPGGTCTLSFSPTSTAAAPTSFNIYGTNTSTVTGTISIGPFAYVSGNQPEALYQCPMNDDGSLGTCVDPGNSGVPFDRPLGIVVNAGNSVAYVANFSGEPVSACPVNANGSFGSCEYAIPLGSMISGVNDLTLTRDGSMAYLALNAVANVYMCPVDASTGLFGTCSVAGNVGTRQLSVPINDHVSPHKLYVSRGDRGISTCTISATDGTLSECTVFDSPELVNLSGMAVNPAGSFLYALDIAGEQVFMCALSVTDGALDECVRTGPSLSFENNRSAIAINQAGTKAYITVPPDNGIAVCAINANGTLSDTCVNETGGGMSRPQGIGLAER